MRDIVDMEEIRAEDLIRKIDALDVVNTIALDLRKRKRFGEEYVATWCSEVIKELPLIKPRSRGWWICNNEELYCSRCRLGWDYTVGIFEKAEEYKFCPYCGAEMPAVIDGREKEE